VNARNARTHSRKQIQQIANSIKAFGFINPVLIDDQRMLVAGHGRLLAAKELGLSTIPAIQIDHLNEDEKRAYLLADNKIAENASWDQDLLRVELEFLTQLDIELDVELTGFVMPEIDILLGEAAATTNEEDPPPPLPSAEDTITQPGDCWQLGPHRLICGDCREPEIVDRLMEDKFARQVITDVPYNMPIKGHVCGLGKNKHPNFAMGYGELSVEAFTAFLTDSLGQLARVSRDGALHYVFIDWRHLEEILAAGRAVYASMVNLCIWNKTNGGMGSLYRSQHELVPVFKHGTAPHINNVELGKHGRYRTNV
jgi:hypothetical protein